MQRRRQGAGLRRVLGRAERAAAQGATRRVGRVGARERVVALLRLLPADHVRLRRTTCASRRRHFLLPPTPGSAYIFRALPPYFLPPITNRSFRLGTQ